MKNEKRLPLTAIPVFYSEQMTAPQQGYSPSAAKPQKAVDDWMQRRLPISLQTVHAIKRPQLYLAHDRRYIDDVLALRQSNGFGTRCAQVAKAVRYTNGSMFDAAKEAIRNGRVAVSPSSGFHHAGFRSGSGFCTFNGLMVAAMNLRYEGRAQRIGILDLDMHYGNGTDDIIERMDCHYVKHFTGGKYFHKPNEARGFLNDLPGIVSAFAGCDVLLYQAGADPHINDPLGGWLTTKQLKMRDRLVFSTARSIGLPVAWNLAGGYQDPFENVLEVHCNTMRMCADIYLDQNHLWNAA